MNRCLCCGKPLNEGECNWHKSCLKRFFGTDKLPDIKIDSKTLMDLANKTVSKGFTVPGVQKKLSLHLSHEKKVSRLTLVDYPSGYIIKPQVGDFERLPEAEHLAMAMAKKSGLSVVPHALIETGIGWVYITKRIDRVCRGKSVCKLAMEDFCQLDLRLTADKYKGSYERCAKIIERYSVQPGLDISELFMRLVFSYIIGNSDMHLKNLSLIEATPGKGDYVLSPAYDFLPVNVVMPEDKEEFALTMNGKKTHIRKKDFTIFAERCGLSAISCKKIIRKLVALEPVYLSMIDESNLSETMKKAFAKLLAKRCENLMR